MVTLEYIEEYISRHGFPVCTIDETEDHIRVLGIPERDGQERLWMWYPHRDNNSIEIGLYDPESGNPALKIKDAGVPRLRASEFSLRDFPVFCMMLQDILKAASLS